MNSSSTSHEDCPADCDQAKLMVSGLIRLDRGDDQPVEVRRGMSIWTRDGQKVGKVAALVVVHDGEGPSHILLGRLPDVLGYLCIPVDLITSVEYDSVYVVFTSQEIEDLSPWCSNI